MGEVVQLTDWRERRPAPSKDWACVWAELDFLPPISLCNKVMDAASLVCCTASSLYGVCPWEDFGQVIRHVIKSARPDIWPPASVEEWLAVVSIFETFQARQMRYLEKFGPRDAPRKGCQTRQGGPWATIWPELEVYPTPGQKSLIADLLEEIAQFYLELGKPEPEDLGLWFKGLAQRLGKNAWPPMTRAAWQKAVRATKAARDDLAARVRGQDQRTPEQNRKIWALVRERLAGDRDMLDALLARHFPQATKTDKQGHKAPSTKALTKEDARQLIEMLQNPAYVPRRRKGRW